MIGDLRKWGILRNFDLKFKYHLFYLADKPAAVCQHDLFTF